MQFFEQVCGGRVVIAATVVADPELEGDRVMREIDASCWIQAKRDFGYALSSVQEWLLGEFYRKQKEAALRSS